jgi:predicted Fe-Mo cluster-binding NifX family protein
MLICLPTQGDSGDTDVICDHFGSAPFFTLYDTDSEEFTIVKNHNDHHGHGSCNPLGQLHDYAIDGVVCKGMGRRAIDLLQKANVKVYYGGVGTVAEVIARFKAGEIIEIDPAQACSGHGHTGGCGH